MTTYPTFLLETAGRYEYKIIDDCYVPEFDLTVRAGSETNLSSVPRLLWSIFPPHGAMREPSIVHDFLIRSGKDRHFADVVFLRLLKKVMPEWQATIIYLSLRIFKKIRNKHEVKL